MPEWRASTAIFPLSLGGFSFHDSGGMFFEQVLGDAVVGVKRLSATPIKAGWSGLRSKWCSALGLDPLIFGDLASAQICHKLAPLQDRHSMPFLVGYFGGSNFKNQVRGMTR